MYLDFLVGGQPAKSKMTKWPLRALWEPRNHPSGTDFPMSWGPTAWPPPHWPTVSSVPLITNHRKDSPHGASGTIGNKDVRDQWALPEVGTAWWASCPQEILSCSSPGSPQGRPPRALLSPSPEIRKTEYQVLSASTIYFPFIPSKVQSGTGNSEEEDKLQGHCPTPQLRPRSPADVHEDKAGRLSDYFSYKSVLGASSKNSENTTTGTAHNVRSPFAALGQEGWLF